MARTVTAREEARRKRWASFLTPLVGVGREVSVANLDRAVQRVRSVKRSETSDDRAAIYAYLNGGSRTVSAGRAWAIGEGLCEVGVAWCSGLLALHEAGYHAELVDCIVALAQHDDPQRAASVAVGIAASAASGNDLVAEARLILAASYDAEAFAAAWDETLDDRKQQTWARDLGFDLRTARLAAESSDLPDREREARVLAALSEWVEATHYDVIKAHKKVRFIATRWRAEVDVLRIGIERAKEKALGIGPPLIREGALPFTPPHGELGRAAMDRLIEAGLNNRTVDRESPEQEAQSDRKVGRQ